MDYLKLREHMAIQKKRSKVQKQKDVVIMLQIIKHGKKDIKEKAAHIRQNIHERKQVIKPKIKDEDV